jgi:hypothetical protein
VVRYDQFPLITLDALLTKFSSVRKICFDMSQHKRRFIADVARTINTSRFKWLVDDLTANTVAHPSLQISYSTSGYNEELEKYRNVRLSIQDTISSESYALEDDILNIGVRKNNKEAVK